MSAALVIQAFVIHSTFWLLHSLLSSLSSLLFNLFGSTIIFARLLDPVHAVTVGTNRDWLADLSLEPAGDNIPGGYIMFLVAFLTGGVNLWATERHIGWRRSDFFVIGVGGTEAMALDASDLLGEVDARELFVDERRMTDVTRRIGTERVENRAVILSV